MHWIIPALIVPLINAVNNFADKYLVSGAIKSWKVIPVYGAFFGFAVSIAIWGALGFFSPGIYSLFGVASGITTVAAVTAYYKLMNRHDVSEMVFFLGLTSPLVLLLSYVLLGERISFFQLVGFVLILFAVALITFKKEQAHFRWSKTMALILTADGMWALGAVLMKFAINENSFIRSLCYEGWGMGLAGLLIFAFSPDIRNNFFKNFDSMKKRTLLIFGADEVLSVAGRYVEYFAYSIGPIALVSVVVGTQAFYCILLGLILTIVIPGVIKEDITGKNLFKKLVAAVILVVGLYFINT